MTREEAILALGLPADALPSRIEAAHKEKRKELIASLKLTSDREVKAQLRGQLDALDVARRIALQVDVPGPVQQTYVPDQPTQMRGVGGMTGQTTISQATTAATGPGIVPQGRPPAGTASSPHQATVVMQRQGDAALPQQTRSTPDQAGETWAALKPQPGKMLMNRYEVLERIGAGGMGEVYRAHDHTLGETIAIKVLHSQYLDNEVARIRFFEEARISILLTHPNIVNVFDLQKDGNLYFLTMELLHGHTLRREIEKRLKRNQKFTVSEVQSIAQAMCAGLGYAHRDMVHRDIKPENVWLCSDGTIKLMDFGIARLHTTTRSTLTFAGMGTAYYISPEQMKGAKDVDHRADQYSTAVVIYELLIGDVPTGKMEPVRKFREDVSKKMSAAVDRALSVDPVDRFPSIEEFAQALCDDQPDWKKRLFQQVRKR